MFNIATKTDLQNTNRAIEQLRTTLNMHIAEHCAHLKELNDMFKLNIAKIEAKHQTDLQNIRGFYDEVECIRKIKLLKDNAHISNWMTSINDSILEITKPVKPTKSKAKK